MNMIKKYWDSVYIYVLLLIPALCICAGMFWSGMKMIGKYPDLSWIKILIFDGTQIIYLAISLYIICRNNKDSSFIPRHLLFVKGFISFLLIVQYNFILYLFSSTHVWECTFLFFACIALLFDSKLLCFNIIVYFISLIIAHLIRPMQFLPMERLDLFEIIAYRFLIFTLMAFTMMIIVYLVEHFLIHARESDEENARLLKKQLDYYKNIDFLDTEIRKFRHDIKNHFICMEALIQNGKTEELEKYFRELQDSFSFQEKMYLSGNDIIDAILHHELRQTCQQEVKVTVYGNLPKIQTVTAMDLCTIFSNLLSNAITAANQCACEKKEAQIVLHFSGGSSFFSIEMTNSALGEVKKGKRNQDRNHGYGVRKIKDVVEKYNGGFERKIEQGMMIIKVYLPI